MSKDNLAAAVKKSSMFSFYVAMMLWVIFIGAAYSLNWLGQQDEIRERVIVAARSHFNKDLVYRRWTTMHGGVYVPISEKTPPNPYLSNLTNRDVVTTSGMQLTLVNPDYMTRQVHELARDQYGVLGHITSLNPLRPENRPDAWEEKALLIFEENADEISSIETIDGQAFMRFMRPMKTEEGCLKCHMEQGYKVGDVRGGISVSILMKPYLEAASQQRILYGSGYALIGLFGLSGIWLGGRSTSRAQLELEKKQLLLSKSQELGHIGTWSLDISNNSLVWTEENCRIFDVPIGSVVNYDIFLDKVHPDDRELVNRQWQAAIQGKPYDIEHRILIDGKTRWVREKANLIFDEQGNAINAIGFTQDVTDQKQSFEENRRLEQQLQQSQKMEAMGNLVGGIAHNFNNALAGITGNLYLAKKGAEELPKVVEKLTRAEKLAFQTGETIRQLLSFTRKGIVQKKSIPVAPFLKETIKLHQMTIPENISLQVEVEDLTLVVNGDVSQLQQVLLNLIINARDAVKDVKHPSITIKLSKFYADKDYLKKHPYVKDQNFVCISVRDNGCGIAEQDLQRIFEPFFTTKGVGRGTGLGLSMVFGAIKSHGGHIEVNSVPDKGSLFEIYLPIYEAVEAVLPKKTEDEIILGHREKILLVDDNEMVLEIGKALLEELNYNVLTAKDGQEAVDTYRACKDVIDLLILDVVMPKMGGVEALRTIRQEDPEVKAIFCTGYDKLNAVTEDEGVSLESVITKPFSISELSQKLKSTLG